MTLLGKNPLRSRPLVSGCVLLLVLVTGCAREETGPLPTAEESVRELSSGPVVGAKGHYGGHQWLGLRYAQPPEGPLRWKAPRPPKDGSGTDTAVEHASPCPQLASPFGGVARLEKGTPVGDEDCLALDVYAPAFDTGSVPSGNEQLPVMVWIHGGGNVVGHTGIYDGSRLANEQNVIVVAIQYRLGPLGWFRHPALRKSDTSRAEASGNFALLDTIRALEWVHNNVDRFGGNPENVTIFGESAGGRNVYNLMLSPLAEGLFDRAIVQSGVLGTTAPSKGENFRDNGGDTHSSREILLRLLRRDGRASDRTSARTALANMSEKEIATYLREQSPAELMEVYGPNELGLQIDPPRVFADGHTLPAEDPRKVLSDPERYNDVPLVTGTNRDETRLFMSQDERWIRKWLWLLPRHREKELYHPVAEYTSNLWKANAVDQPAGTMVASGRDHVYAYRFDWDELPTILGTDLSSMIGAGHGLEIPFVFGHYDLGSEQAEQLFTEANRPGRRELSKKMREYWANFARSGDPNDPNRTRWSPWRNRPGENGRYLILDTEADGGLRMGSRTYSTEELREQIDTDSRLENQRERCVVRRAMAGSVGNVTRNDYENTEECRAYPWDEYPWRR